MFRYTYIYMWQEKMSILKYFKLTKPANDHLPDPEGTLSSRLPSSAIASANSEVRSVIDRDWHPQFPTHVYVTGFDKSRL